MNDVLDKKIEDVLDSADRMFIATSVGGNSSGASVFYARDGEDLVFFTFNPTRKAEQIRLNPRVHVVIWPKGQEVKGLQIDGECYKIKDEQEKEKACQIPDVAGCGGGGTVNVVACLRAYQVDEPSRAAFTLFPRNPMSPVNRNFMTLQLKSFC